MAQGLDHHAFGAFVSAPVPTPVERGGGKEEETRAPEGPTYQETFYTQLMKASADKAEVKQKAQQVRDWN
jgi:hypothetical protein